ncbi:hypothetical protein F4860DRAFT_486295 [Xylaria cubensis]|nr:hypothetical protein F4860DRAFT_486295 [Xylaria cubensis]
MFLLIHLVFLVLRFSRIVVLLSTDFAGTPTLPIYTCRWSICYLYIPRRYQKPGSILKPSPSSPPCPKKGKS